MKMKLADALAPKKSRRTMSAQPEVEYDFIPSRIGTKAAYGAGTGYGTGTGGAKPRASQVPKKLKR